MARGWRGLWAGYEAAPLSRVTEGPYSRSMTRGSLHASLKPPHWVPDDDRARLSKSQFDNRMYGHFI